LTPGNTLIRRCYSGLPAPGGIGVFTGWGLLVLSGYIAWPVAHVLAEDVSSPAILQLFEARWQTVEDRMVDIFRAGYGAMWLPPPGKADSGGLSVGYDVFDRFDLGAPRAETLYGTKTGLKTLVHTAHQAGVRVHIDMVLNHNGFRDQSTPGFVEAGDYPGFVVTLDAEDDPQGNGDTDGDFHGAFEGGDLNSRLAGLIDIAQEKNHLFIRHPVGPDPNNIPAGTFHDQPDPGNARLYPDRDQGGTVVFDPRMNANVTLFDFDAAEPLAGDAVPENATGLLMRHARWMVQEIGVDGFRFDAVRHMPTWVLDFIDQGLFLSKKQPLLDGSVQHVFAFSETGFDSFEAIQNFIRKDINPSDLSQLGGNRDALDFPLYAALRDNLTDNGLANDWRNIKNASQDVHLDGLANNGSQGVSFVQSHDDFGPHLDNVGYAYTMMRPGNAIVYMNALEFGDERDFPKQGRGDALGGLFGDTITRLVEVRNTHGRGNYLDRTDAADEKEMLIFERQKSALVVLSNRLDGGFDSRTVQTSFEPGTPLIELTGNAEDTVFDPLDDFPSLLVVKPDRSVDLRVPRNGAPGQDGAVHNKGYLIYGVSGPQGQLRLTNAAGADLTTVLPGGMPTEATNGITRLNDITVVTDETFHVRLETQAVHLLGTHRDRHADGDQALLRIDGGIDVNDAPGVDNVQPGSVQYGFEAFEDVHSPGFFQPDGKGFFQQEIDAAALAEGTHFLTVRGFRHRNPQTFTDGDPLTAGDGGPAVFTDFREAFYVDRLPPESEIVSFAPFANEPDEPENRDLIARSTDGTADNMHMFLNLPAALTENQIYQLAQGGQGNAGPYDRDQWIFGFFGVPTGNHAATVVTFEPTGSFNIQRFSGLAAETAIGAGLGDLDFSGAFEATDVGGLGNGSFEDVLYSQNAQFNPAADINSDGLIDNRDLFQLDTVLTVAGAGGATILELDAVLLRRGNVDQIAGTNAADIDTLYAHAGSSDWLFDLDVDGTTDDADVETLVKLILRTEFGDLDLDGFVDAIDRDRLVANLGQPGLGWGGGDLDGSGIVDQDDLDLLMRNLSLLGDMDRDRDVDFDDIDDFVVGLTDADGYLAEYGVPPALHGDADKDGDFDFDDIDDFIAQLSPAQLGRDVSVPEPAAAELLLAGLAALAAISAGPGRCGP